MTRPLSFAGVEIHPDGYIRYRDQWQSTSTCKASNDDKDLVINGDKASWHVQIPAMRTAEACEFAVTVNIVAREWSALEDR
jgi:hypothetical protein